MFVMYGVVPCPKYECDVKESQQRFIYQQYM